MRKSSVARRCRCGLDCRYRWAIPLARMSSTQSLIEVLKRELRAAGITYAQLAPRIRLSESSVKRMFASADMPLTRIDAICRVLKMDFSEVAQRVAEQREQLRELTMAQERAVVSDARLFLVATCVISQWTVEQMLTTYRISEPEAVRALTQLDRLGIIELRPNNRYRLNIDKAFRWQPNGPVMTYFREQVAGDYFNGGFDGAGELLSVVHGSIARSDAAALADRLQRVAHDFAMQHLADQRLPPAQRAPFTLVIGLRSWWLPSLSAMRRQVDGTAAGGTERAVGDAGRTRKRVQRRK